MCKIGEIFGEGAGYSHILGHIERILVIERGALWEPARDHHGPRFKKKSTRVNNVYKMRCLHEKARETH